MSLIEELTKAEIKSIDLISHKIKYDDPKDVARVCEYLDNKDRLSSEAGRRYLDALRRLCTGKEEVTECIYCNDTLEAGAHIICKSCYNKMLDRSRAMDEAKAIAEDRANKRALIKPRESENEKIGLVLNSANKTMILFIILVICILIFGVIGIIAVKNNAKDKNTNIIEESSTLKPIDGIDFIGKTKDIPDTLFGGSAPILTENALYYNTSGVSIVFDEKTGIINYVDCDNMGTEGSIQIFGINIGWTRDEVTKYLKENDCEYILAEDGSITTYTTVNSDYVEVYIAFEEDEVALVCAYR